jgi:hypothetical protein
LWSTDNFQESAEKVFKWLGHARAHLQSRQELFRKGERAERKRPCWKISMTRFVSPTKIAGLPPHRNPNLTCQTTTRNAQLIAALYFTKSRNTLSWWAGPKVARMLKVSCCER